MNFAPSMSLPFTAPASNPRKMRQKRALLGAAMILMATFLFGLNGSTAKTIMSAGVTAEQITLFRSLSACSIAAIFMLVRNPSSFRVAKPEWKWLILLGTAGVGLMQWSYASAVANLPVGVALLIQYTAIVLVPISGMILFKNRVSPRLWLGVAFVLAGLVVVSHIWQAGLSTIGLIFAAVAAVATTIYYMVGEHVHKTRDAFSTLFYSMAFSALMWVPASHFWNFDFSRFTSTVDLGGNLAGTVIPAWILFGWLGIMGSFVPLFLTYAALPHLSATGVGVMSTTETIFGFMFAYLWLGEKIDGLQTVGGLLVIAGIVIAQISRRSATWQPSN
jgi:drug/metabolite transporter (DMT)-like permease